VARVERPRAAQDGNKGHGALALASPVHPLRVVVEAVAAGQAAVATGDDPTLCAGCARASSPCLRAAARERGNGDKGAAPSGWTSIAAVR